jgi:hypothetical protein
MFKQLLTHLQDPSGFIGPHARRVYIFAESRVLTAVLWRAFLVRVLGYFESETRRVIYRILSCMFESRLELYFH